MTKPLKAFTHADLVRVAEDAADIAVRQSIQQLFEKLDLNLADPDDIRRFRRNLAFLNDQREGAELMKKNITKGAYYLVGVATLGFLYILWDVFKAGIMTLFK